jgi:hypothetical protein
MTHNQRVLALLSDGLPHSHHELYRLYVMAHSRVSDLRKQGHDIRCWREGDSYLYQLVSPSLNGGTTAASVSVPSLSESGSDSSRENGELPPEIADASQPLSLSPSAQGLAAQSSAGESGAGISAEAGPGQLSIEEAA